MQIRAIKIDQMRIALILCAIFFILSLVTVVYAVKQWQVDWQIAHETSKKPLITKTDPGTSLIAAIPSAHLFGKALTKIGDMPITNLQLRVTGISKLNRESSHNASKVTISMDGAIGKVFQVGDSLPYGVKIYAITADAVILENEGRLEKLPLPRDKLEFKPLEPKKG